MNTRLTVRSAVFLSGLACFTSYRPKGTSISLGCRLIVSTWSLFETPLRSSHSNLSSWCVLWGGNQVSHRSNILSRHYRRLDQFETTWIHLPSTAMRLSMMLFAPLACLICNRIARRKNRSLSTQSSALLEATFQWANDKFSPLLELSSDGARSLCLMRLLRTWVRHLLDVADI